MNRTTTIMVALAALSVLGALLMMPRTLPPSSFEDTGEPLFAEFHDPDQAASLEVVEWHADSAQVLRFKVEQKQGRWVIPSHHDYPADASEHMGRAAASFVDVKRDIYYGDKPEDHARFGVLDPESTDSDEAGRGKRVILRDASGATLVDIVIGHAIPDKDGFYYVRFPEQKRVYGSRMELDISTAFTDWIEKDLLRMVPEDIVAMDYDPYQVDESRGVVSKTEAVRVARVVAGGGGGDGNDWSLAPGTKAPEGKVLDSFKMQSMLRDIDGLQIVGVRPRPNPLTLAALQSMGFFVTNDGTRLFGNEGEVRAITRDGIVYTLYFGEVTLDAGLALTAGASGQDDGGKDGGQDGGQDGKNGGQNGENAAASRYLLVDVTYDPSLDQTAGPDTEPDAKAATPAEPAATPAEPGAKPGATPGDEPAKADSPRQQHQAQAIALQERFMQWFYVISDDSFKKIHGARADYFKDPPKPATP